MPFDLCGFFWDLTVPQSLEKAGLCAAGPVKENQDTTQNSKSMPEYQSVGNGVICKTRALPRAVIPAKAGIHAEGNWRWAADGLDSRLRGNDPLADGFRGRSGSK